MPNGTIIILGDLSEIPDEVRCPYNCGGGDVTVDTITGKCKICQRVFKIQTTEIIVKV